jgi:hypothetical protein
VPVFEAVDAPVAHRAVEVLLCELLGALPDLLGFLGRLRVRDEELSHRRGRLAGLGAFAVSQFRC